MKRGQTPNIGGFHTIAPLFFYDVAATWISLGLLGCQLDREESTIAAGIDLDKKLRVGDRFGEYDSWG